MLRGNICRCQQGMTLSVLYNSYKYDMVHEDEHQLLLRGVAGQWERFESPKHWVPRTPLVVETDKPRSRPLQRVEAPWMQTPRQFDVISCTKHIKLIGRFSAYAFVVGLEKVRANVFVGRRCRCSRLQQLLRAENTQDTQSGNIHRLRA